MEILIDHLPTLKRNKRELPFLEKGHKNFWAILMYRMRGNSCTGENTPHFAKFKRRTSQGIICHRTRIFPPAGKSDYQFANAQEKQKRTTLFEKRVQKLLGDTDVSHDRQFLHRRKYPALCKVQKANFAGNHLPPHTDFPASGKIRLSVCQRSEKTRKPPFLEKGYKNFWAILTYRMAVNSCTGENPTTLCKVQKANFAGIAERVKN